MHYKHTLEKRFMHFLIKYFSICLNDAERNVFMQRNLVDAFKNLRLLRSVCDDSAQGKSSIF